METMRKLMFICTIFIYCSCDPMDAKLQLFNTSKDTVYFCLSTDTILNQNIYLYKLLPLDSARPSFAWGKRGSGAFEDKVYKKSKDSTLHIFFFNPIILRDSVVKTHHPNYTIKVIDDDVINNQKYKRMDFKVKDLDSLGWVITYK